MNSIWMYCNLDIPFKQMQYNNIILTIIIIFITRYNNMCNTTKKGLQMFDMLPLGMEENIGTKIFLIIPFNIFENINQIVV